MLPVPKFAADATNLSATGASQAVAIPNDANGNRAKFVFINCDGGTTPSIDDMSGIYILVATDEAGGSPTSLGGATSVTGGAGGNGIYIRAKQSMILNVAGWSHILVLGENGGEDTTIAPVDW